MDRMKMAQSRAFPAMMAAMLMALTVNAAFGLALGGASTKGQRIYDALHHNGATMYADSSTGLHRPGARG